MPFIKKSFFIKKMASFSETKKYRPSEWDKLFDSSLINGHLFPELSPSYHISDENIEIFKDTKGKLQCMNVFTPIGDKSKLCIIYFHGNSTDIGDCSKKLLLYSYWLDCLFIGIEYSGYGHSDGERTQESIIQKCADSILYINTIIKIPLHRIILFGHSIGCALALKMNSLFDGQFGGLILQSPFTSVKEVTKVHSFFSSLFLSGSVLDNVEEIKKMKPNQMLMLIHGEKDELIPHAHSRELYEKCNLKENRKFMFIDKEGTHNGFQKDNLKLLILIPFVKNCEKEFFNIRNDLPFCVRPEKTRLFDPKEYQRLTKIDDKIPKRKKIKSIWIGSNGFCDFLTIDEMEMAKYSKKNNLTIEEHDLLLLLSI